MHIANEEFDESMVFHHIRCFNIRVPVRFESYDLEKSFRDYVRQEREYFSVVLVILVVGSLTQAAGVWEDVAEIVRGQGEPWNYFLACSALLSVLFYVACLVCHRVFPSFFTESRRLPFLMLTLTRYALCNRPVALAIFNRNWPYNATNQFRPPIIWVAIASMIICSASCQSWCLPCKHSLIMCTYTLVLVCAQSFLLPSGREALQQCLLLTALVTVQIILCFTGHTNIENAERRVFLHLLSSKHALVEERVKRYEAERRAEEPIQVEKDAKKTNPSDGDRPPSDVASRKSSSVFRGLLSSSSADVQKLEELGKEEHWLIQPNDLALHPDRILGAGAFGSVVVGTWMSGEVAVKVPTSRAHDDYHPLALEIRHLRKLRHPCIVSFLGVCIASNYEFLLVEELVVGDNLKVFISNLGSFANQCTRFRQHMLLDVSAALHYLHSQRPAIVHGDLKPENIIVDRHWVSKLTDFGLARRSATREKMPGGTRKWLERRLRASSQSDGVHESDDMWALGGDTIRGSRAIEIFGATVCALWRGDLDEEEDSSTTVANKQLALTGSEDLSLLSALCYKCMDPDPHDRPTARDVHQEVLRWRNKGETSRKNLVLSSGYAQLGDSNNPLLDEQIAVVRTSMAERGSRASWMRKEELPVDGLNDIKGALRQQCDYLQRLLRSDSHYRQSLYIMHMLLASVFHEKSFAKTGISL
eukprot:TRINITY_DN3781_c0_g1_i8.p1 TRINITY_DN3781_c0_g1~~TRINITY_DN3781_c0_g1_i8.p1  ORF type:complete len:702 (-),score=55.86 TRINITY_DN3781_c0_g1_i8:263-2368(-)